MSVGERVAASPRARWLVFAAVAALALVPVALVRYPPVLDLAQQTSQIPLLSRALGAEAATYRVEWATPNKLSYLLIALGWWAGGAVLGARLGLALCLLATLGAIHFLAALFHRPAGHAALASIFVFSSSFYGGFFNFQLGAWGLAIWLHELARQGSDERSGRVVARALLVGLLLYWSHALWLLAALALLALFALARPESRRHAPARALGLLPFLAVFALWNWSTESATRGAGVVLFESGWSERLLSAAAWSNRLLGGLRGLVEPIALAGLALAAFAALWPRRRERLAGLEPALALAALPLLAAALVLPDHVGDTGLFAVRWAPWAAICLVLALPAWRLAPRAAIALALLFLAAFLVPTTLAWRSFDRDTMRGFDECRAAVPAGSRLLSLDFAREHRRFFIYPTFQMAAYMALDRSVELAFSFAEHRSSLVTYRTLPRPTAWTPRLEHYPERLVPRDFDFFDRVLLHLPPGTATEAARRFPRLVPLSGNGDWRLYGVVPAWAGGAAARPSGRGSNGR